MFWKYAPNLRENTYAEVSLQLYWNSTLAWVFSSKFAAYFKNAFSQEHSWTAASVRPTQVFASQLFSISFEVYLSVSECYKIKIDMSKKIIGFLTNLAEFTKIFELFAANVSVKNLQYLPTAAIILFSAVN